MYYDKSDIENMDRVKRLLIINAVSGIRPANLIGTKSNDGQSNLAIFSSVVHLGSQPGYFGMITRPDADVRRHTLENIKSTGVYTINHVHGDIIKQAHYTSAKFGDEESEFDKCQLTEEYLHDFHAPFVGESQLKMGLKLVETIHIQSTNCLMVIGELQHLILPDYAMDERSYIDLAACDTVGVSGLNNYYRLSKIGEFPYARLSEVPDFTKE